jgi:hypothetical protein
VKVATHLQVMHVLRIFTYAFCVRGMTLNIWKTFFSVVFPCMLIITQLLFQLNALVFYY